MTTERQGADVLQQQDALARERAIDLARSIVLQAPAGSGKTTVLAQRFLRALAAVDDPEAVLAMTFTRKAAAELRRRVLEALQDAQASRQPPRHPLLAEFAQAALRHGIERNWNLLEDPARLRIRTIDAVLFQLAATLPVSTGLGGTPGLREDPELLYLDAARAALRDGERDPELAPHVDRALRRADNRQDALAELLAELLARRALWLRHVLGADEEIVVGAERALARAVGVALDRIEQHIGVGLLREGLALVREAASQLRTDQRETPAAWRDWLALGGVEPPFAAGALEERRAAWAAVAGLALTGQQGTRATLRRSVTVGLGFPADDQERKRRGVAWLSRLSQKPSTPALLQEARLLPAIRLPDPDRELLLSLVKLLRYATAQLELRFAEAGEVDHAHVARAGLRALFEDGRPTDAGLRESLKLRHLLVDEFQDTSGEQFELLERLMMAWDRDEPRSCFLVGDPMQSIYLFREARVELFLEARDRGIGAWRFERLELHRNFRSAKRIVQFNNSLFDACFPREDDPLRSGIRYLASSGAAALANTGPGEIVLHRAQPGDLEDQCGRIVAIVREFRERYPDAAAPGASIAVLVRSHTIARPVVAALRAAGFAVQARAAGNVAAMQGVLDVVALARAVADLADRTAWLAVLRAPWCALSLESLQRIADRAGDRTVLEALTEAAPTELCPDADERRALERTFDVLRRALSRELAAPLAARVEQAWLALDGPAACASEDEVRAAQDWLGALAASAARGAPLDAQHFEWLLEAQGRAEPAPGGDHAVQVMTVHAAKGLEFGCVILCGLERGRRSGDARLLRWFEWRSEPDAAAARGAVAESGAEVLFAPLPDPRDPASGRLNAWVRFLEQQREHNEELRILYVAATRAIRSLHLLAAPRKEPAIDALPSGASPQLARLWPFLKDCFPRTPGTAVWDGEAGVGRVTKDAAAARPAPLSPAPRATPERRIRRLIASPIALDCAADAHAPRETGLRLLAHVPRPAERPSFDWVSEVARRVGIVVHEELQRLARPGGCSRGLEDYRGRLRAHGLRDPDLAAAAARVQRAIRTTLADPDGRWVLDASHMEAVSEHALNGVINGELRSVVVDRSFVDRDGTRWVIDFKTSEHEGGGIEAFLANELQRYAPQLETYVALVRELDPSRPVRAALYFPLLGRLARLGES